MLQKLRDKAQGWIAWVIVGLIGFTFVLIGAESVFDTSGKQEIVAKVDGQKITASELNTLYQQSLKQPGNTSLKQEDPTSVKKDLLDSLIEQTVIVQTALRSGMTITPQRITQYLSTVPFLTNDKGDFSKEAYYQFLANANFTDQSFRTALKDSLLIDQLQQGFTRTSFALNDEVAELAKFFLQKRDFRYTTVAKEPFVKLIEVTPEESKQYYEAHAQDFLTEEQVAIEYIHLSMPELMKKYQPKEEELEQFYKENPDLFKEPFEEVKLEVAEKLKHQWAEEKWLNMADELSTLAYDTPDSLQPAADKLELPIQKTILFSRERGPKEAILQNPEIITAAFSEAVKNDKNNSDLIKLDEENYIVLRILTHRPAKQMSFEQVKKDIQSALLIEKSNALAKEQAEKIADTITKTSEEALPTLLSSYQWHEEKAIGRDSNAVEPDILQAAFAMPRPLGQVRELKVMQLDSGDCIVIWLTEIEDGSIVNVSNEDQKKYREALTRRWGELDFSLYAVDLFANAKVKKYIERV